MKSGQRGREWTEKNKGDKLEKKREKYCRKNVETDRSSLAM